MWRIFLLHNITLFCSKRPKLFWKSSKFSIEILNWYLTSISRNMAQLVIDKIILWRHLVRHATLFGKMWIHVELFFWKTTHIFMYSLNEMCIQFDFVSSKLLHNLPHCYVAQKNATTRTLAQNKLIILLLK